MHNLNDRNVGIATDQAVLTIHQDLTAMNIQLLQQMDETQEKKGTYNNNNNNNNNNNKNNNNNNDDDNDLTFYY